MASHGVFISQMVVSATPGTRCERIGCRGLSQWLSENWSTKQLINLWHQAEIEIKDKEKDLALALLERQLQIKEKDKGRPLWRRTGPSWRTTVTR